MYVLYIFVRILTQPAYSIGETPKETGFFYPIQTLQGVSSELFSYFDKDLRRCVTVVIIIQYA